MPTRLRYGLGLAGLLLVAGGAAGQTVTWNFDVTTWGEDAYWNSPTATDPNADAFATSYHVSQVIATVRYLFFDIPVDVTNQIDPAMLDGADVLWGPPPIIVQDDYVVYPPPPEPPGLSAHVTMWLDVNGYGHAAVTEVVFGQIQLDPYGMVTVRAIQVVGSLTVEPTYYDPGDTNCDHALNALDINPFVRAMTSPEAYALEYPDCNHLQADMDGDGLVNALDINPFVQALTGQ